MTNAASTSGARRKAEPKVNPLLLMVGAAGISAMIYMLGTQPALNQAAELSSQRQILEEEVAKQQAVIGQLPRLKSDNERLKLAAIESKLRFPQQEQFASLVRDLNIAAANSGVRVLSMTRTVTASSIPGIDRLEVQTNLAGSYTGIQNMIESLQQRQRYIGTESLTFNTEAEGLTTSALFTAYMLRPAPKDAPAEGESTQTPADSTGQGGS